MVRLKDSYESTTYSAKAFQFQYGTIKRNEKLKLLRESNEFQFQYGTIKSIIFLYLNDYFGRFNSNMVRLKGLITLKN